MLVPVVIYGSEALLWKEKEISRIEAVQMDNFRRLLGVERMDRIQNARVRELCKVTKYVNERTDEGVFRWIGYVERMDKDRIAKRVYVGDHDGSRSLGRRRRDGLIPCRSA